MQVGTLSVQKLFERGVHYMIPLYQRPYVWTETDQWRPLWEELCPLAEQVAVGTPARAHFMGASVQELVPVPAGATEIRLIIDGQQRLTTLQLLLKAFRDVAQTRGQGSYAAAITKLIANDDPLIEDARKRHKLWPTQTDQQSFQSVMDANSPAELLQTLGMAASKYPIKGSAIANAYLFFHAEIDSWLNTDPSRRDDRIKGLYGAIRDHLRLVVIDLDDKDDAQAIFETLNARGTPLLSADLVKNSILGELAPPDAEEAYRKYWRSFDQDSGFWRELIGRGHAQRARIETFLQHTLTLLTGESVSAAHLYSAYRNYAESPDSGSAIDRLKQLRRLGDIYKRLHGQHLDPRLATFFYRLNVLDVVTAWPFILALYEKLEQQPDQIRTILIDLESYLVRRMVCRLSTRGYGLTFASLTRTLVQDADNAIGVVRSFLMSGEAEVDRWPDDGEFETAWRTYPLYTNLTRPRLRFLLEAMEEAKRTAWTEETAAPRGLTIEHVMPQGWREHWPLLEGTTASERDGFVQTIGNLTLLTNKLNIHQSNRPWIDGRSPESGKRSNLAAQAVLFLNKELSDHANWTDDSVEERGRHLFSTARVIWPRAV